ncbi:hypothetical protein BDZ89DRAFT_1082569 [Hymenopellis radicata]|nr:hypothetical protein BDZ89DRAFT_1082569 [Hymenopellis radicata]
MIDIPGLAQTSSQLSHRSSNGITDVKDPSQDLAILESLKRKIKAGQHPAFKPTPQPEALRSVWKGPAYPPAADHKDIRVDISRPASTAKPNPPPAVNERLPFVSSRGPQEPTSIKSSSSAFLSNRDSDMDKKPSPPHHTSRNYAGRELGPDSRRESYPSGDRFIPRDSRPLTSDDQRSVPLDTRRPPPEERHYEPSREREYMDSYSRDRRPLHDAPLSDRRPLDDHPPVRDTRPAPRASSLERRVLPLPSRPPFEDRRPPQPTVDDRRPLRDRPMLEERRRSLSPVARRPIFEERRPLPPRSPPPFIKPDDSIQRVPSLSERLKTPPVASMAVTPRVEPSRFATPTLPTDRRPVFEERRPPPPTPPKSAHLPSLSERLKTPPPPSARLRSPPRTRAPSPPPLSARVRPPPNNYRPGENNYRPAEPNNYRPPPPPEPNSYRPAEMNSYRPPPPESNNHRPAENSYRPPPPEANSYRPSEGSAYPPPPPGANSYRPGELTNYRPREENNYRPGDVYERRERPEYVASGARAEPERRRASPPPPPPRPTGGWVDDYRDRGRERENEYYRPPVSHADRHPPYPPVRKRSPSPAPIGYDPKRARYEPDARYYSYDRPRSPVGGRR